MDTKYYTFEQFLDDLPSRRITDTRGHRWGGTEDNPREYRVFLYGGCWRSVNATWKQIQGMRARANKQRHDWKNKMFGLLGRECERCGFDDERALQIDHIMGDGSKDRISNHGGTATYYKHVIESGGVGYQILCANCNSIKRVENEENTRPFRFLFLEN